MKPLPSVPSLRWFDLGGFGKSVSTALAGVGQIQAQAPEFLRGYAHALQEVRLGRVQIAVVSSVPPIRERVVAQLVARATGLAGVTAAYVSPEGHEIVFTGPARAPEIVDACNEVVRAIQHEIAPTWTPVLRGFFQARGLEDLEGYTFVSLKP